jgi:hypothetical protein
MKTLLFTIILLPLFSSAQDSCKLKKETDPFSHQTKISTGFVPFVSNGVQLSISVDATSTDIDIFLWLKDGKCFDDQSSVQVNYEGDRSKGNFRNTGSMNCEGAFHFTFRNTASTPGTLNRMTTARIASLKITDSNKKITEVSFNEEQKQQLLRMISCVVREGKTLIK